MCLDFLCFFFFFWPWDLRSSTRDQTHVSRIESVASQPLGHQESPDPCFLSTDHFRQSLRHLESLSSQHPTGECGDTQEEDVIKGRLSDLSGPMCL